MKKIYVLSLLFATSSAFSLTFPIPRNSNIVGTMQTAIVQEGESLGDIGRKFDIGVYEMIEANPSLDPWDPEIGSNVVVPSQFILPEKLNKRGIIINLAEMRLYYFQPKKNLVSTHPIGIGKKDWLTPLGKTKIIAKKQNPTWRPPKSIRNAALAKGKPLPKVVKPGPSNPLGKYALRLNIPGYLIHGTNRLGGIGVRSSSGCIRMFPEDIESLFHKVSVGTLVKIVHEPLKIGLKNDNLYLEAHEPLSDAYYNEENLVNNLYKTIIDSKYPESYFDRIINSKSFNKFIGYPVIIH